MKVVYFGSDVFLSCFEYFVEKHQVLALYTYHNDEDYFTEYAIVKRAGELGIPVHYEAISPEEIRRYFTEEGCELFFIAEYDRILTLPEELPAFRGINTHSSLLPQGRSYYPIEGAMERELEQMPSVDDFQTVADIFKQLGDGSRIRIFWLLCHCEECVINLSSMVEMSSPAVSHHLKQLKAGGLIVSRRDGKEVYYKAAETERAQLLHHMIEAMVEIACPSA